MVERPLSLQTADRSGSIAGVHERPLTDIRSLRLRRAESAQRRPAASAALLPLATRSWPAAEGRERPLITIRDAARSY